MSYSNAINTARTKKDSVLKKNTLNSNTHCCFHPDTLSGDNASYAVDSDDCSSSSEEMMLDRPKRPRASTGSGGSIVSDDFSLYKESMPATGGRLLGTPTESSFRTRTGRVTPTDKMIAVKKRGTYSDMTQ
jgi:hypothetical protein